MMTFTDIMLIMLLFYAMCNNDLLTKANKMLMGKKRATIMPQWKIVLNMVCAILFALLVMWATSQWA